MPRTNKRDQSSGFGRVGLGSMSCDFEVAVELDRYLRSHRDKSKSDVVNEALRQFLESQDAMNEIARNAGGRG